MSKSITQKITDMSNNMKRSSQKENIVANITGNLPKFGFNQLVKHKPNLEEYTVVSIHVPENNQWFYNLRNQHQEVFRIPEDELIEV